MGEMKGWRNTAQPEKKIYAWNMRNNPTSSEKILWEELRLKKLGVKFRRQCIIRGWIVDFYCQELRLVIEVDGGYHNDKIKYDLFRDSKMKKLDLNIIRVKDYEVINNLQKVLNYIKGYIKSSKIEKR